MSHVDKGALHAYLDGALDEYPQAEAERIREHLDGCATCAEMLEVERTVRASAEAMLALAVPDVDLPSLEELRAYVKRTRPIRQTASVRIYRMGWAASVVLALGTGWMLRGGELLESPQVGSVDFEAESSAPSVNSLARSAEPTVLNDASAGDATGVEAARANAAGVEAARVDATGADAMRERAAVPVERVDQPASIGGGYAASASSAVGEAAPPAPSAKLGESETGSARAMRAEAEGRGVPESGSPESGLSEVLVPESEGPEAEIVRSPAVAPAPADPDVAGAGEVDDVVAFADASDDGAAQPSDDVAELEAMRPDAPSLAEPAADGVADELRGGGISSLTADTGSPAENDSSQRNERRRSDSPVAATSALEQTGRGNRQAPAEDDVQKRVEEVSMAVPGHELLSVTNLGEGTTPLGVQVVQRLEGGELLEIFHLQPEIEPSILPRSDEGVNEVSVLAENGWIVMRGRLTTEDLEGLLASLFPEG